MSSVQGLHKVTGSDQVLETKPVTFTYVFLTYIVNF